MKISDIIIGIVIFLIVMFLVYRFIGFATYKIFYEDRVKETIHEMIINGELRGYDGSQK